VVVHRSPVSQKAGDRLERATGIDQALVAVDVGNKLTRVRNLQPNRQRVAEWSLRESCVLFATITLACEPTFSR
jgi:hypothetical protein